MDYSIDGKVYRMASGLNEFQRDLYRHLIDWKAREITPEPGCHKGNYYDYMFPAEYQEGGKIPPFIYPGVRDALSLMQSPDCKYRYKMHKMAYHMASSQSACVNLFMPVLLDACADEIVSRIPGCPSDFIKIDRDRLFNGFCFEYWGQGFDGDENLTAGGKGLLGDHSVGAGTDADIAIAYLNARNEHCLWLIEHKLTETDFTNCGGYSSRKNGNRSCCTSDNIKDIISVPSKCNYHNKGYKYWEMMRAWSGCFRLDGRASGCPFREGVNQLWRNQLLAFALESTGRYAHVSFSVVHHRDNHCLDRAMNEYRKLIASPVTFTSFTNADVVSVAERHSPALAHWCEWYKGLYRL